MSKVLIVDDDNMSRRMADFIVKKGGHTTVLAASGEEGIALIKSEHPDVVLLDVEMPNMSGYETLTRIKEDESIADTRVIFLTGLIDDEVQQKVEELGAAGVIAKPIEPQKLFEILG